MPERFQGFKGLFVKTPEEQRAEKRVIEIKERLAERGRLSTRDQNQLESYSLLTQRATRRVFLARTAAAIGGLGAAVALGNLGIRRFTEDDSQSLDVEKKIDAKSELLHEIEFLPPSTIKDLLAERVAPYFKTPTPFIAKRGDFRYPVHASAVTKAFTIDPNKAKDVDGTYEVVAPIFSSEPIHLTENKRFKIPLVAGLVQEHEKRLFLPENHATDGTILINVDIDVKDTIVEGVAPRITIVRPRPEIVPQDSKDVINTFERLVFIKEAASSLLYDILGEQTYLKMNALGLPIYAQAIKSNREFVQVEVVHALLTTINNSNGRLLAALDAGAIIVALKAMEKVQSLPLVRRDKRLAPIFDSLPTINLGNDAPTILSRAFAWAINYPAVNNLPIKGDMKKIP